MSNPAGTTKQKMLWGNRAKFSQALMSPAFQEEPGPVTVDHVADFQHRYPGESVRLYTRLTIREQMSDLTLRVTLPEGLELEDYQTSSDVVNRVPYVEVDKRSHYLVWSLAGELAADSRFEYQATAKIAPVLDNRILESEAIVSNKSLKVLAEESVAIALWAKGRYLRHLPEIYEQDDFMGRFLMLFESFWAPIQNQIAAAPEYLEPRMTPAIFVPWLASWLGLELDDRWPEDRQRQLVRSAIWLLRQRGTKQALRQYLEIYTGGQVKITEHRAADFRLGSSGKLGLGVALGTGNHPHTFTVRILLPAEPSSGMEEEGAAQLQIQRRMIEAIIGAEKPAHTTYTLKITSQQEEGDRT
jgi:phage tail-like protein